ATLTLSATVRSTNTCSDDVRKTKVTFAIRNGANLTPLSNAQNLPVSLVNPNDTTVGTATAVSQYNMDSADAATLDLGVIVSGDGYKTAYDDAIVTIAKPGAGNAIVGGGTLLNEGSPASSGYLAGAAGYPTSISTNVEYNKNKTNPQGKVSI